MQKIIKIEDPREIVGSFFEKKVADLFALRKADQSNSGDLPDLVSADGCFFVEVKASAYNNGGVIKKAQLLRFDSTINRRRFYAFAYHSIGKNMQKRFPTRKRLEAALDLRSVYLLPFSIVLTYFDRSKKRINQKYGEFVQLRESVAGQIFTLQDEAWTRLHLNRVDYMTTKLHERVYVMTRKDHLLKDIT